MWPGSPVFPLIYQVHRLSHPHFRNSLHGYTPWQARDRQLYPSSIDMKKRKQIKNLETLWNANRIRIARELAFIEKFRYFLTDYWRISVKSCPLLNHRLSTEFTTSYFITPMQSHQNRLKNSSLIDARSLDLVIVSFTRYHKGFWYQHQSIYMCIHKFSILNAMELRNRNYDRTFSTRFNSFLFPHIH